MTNSIIPKLISDTPTDDDKFEVHKRLSKTIAKLILSGDGGKTASLEGEWGAGKSTVIKLLDKELEAYPNIKILVYDAWVHSGDPLRRVFLETLIDQLLKENWLIEPSKEHIKKFSSNFLSRHINKNDSYWEKKKKSLSGLFKSTSKTVTPKFTKCGIVFLFSLFLLPLSSYTFVNLLVAYLKDTWIFTTEPYLKWLFCLSATLVMTPIVILMLVVIIAKNKELFWSLLANKTVNEEETTTVDTPEPSSIEFQTLFCEAMEMALDRSDRKLIIVIDNLDRLKSEDAESVWAMLRSFVDDSILQSTSYSWTKNLWVLIPVATNVKNIEVKSEFNNLTLSKISNSEQFLEKVFQVRFHLPSPVLENWQNYLIDLLEKALGQQDNLEYKTITRLYESHLGVMVGQQQLLKASRPTPRALIHFVNDIVVLKLLWENTFPVSTLAAYTLNTKNIDVLISLKTNLIPTTETKRILGNDVLRDFPAIYFNVEDSAKAQELLKVGQLRQYLVDGKIESLLQELTFNPYLEKVLVGLIEILLDESSSTNLNVFLSAIITLGGFEKEELIAKYSYKLNPSTNKVIEKELLKGFNRFTALPLLSPSISEAVTCALLILGNEKFPMVVIDLLMKISNNQKLISSDSFIPSEESGEEWWDELSKVFQIPVIAEHISKLADRTILLPITPENGLRFTKNFIRHSSL